METVEVRIMGREFRVACTAEEKPALLRAVDIVSARMENIRDSGRVVGVDRIAVMAALQIAHDTLKKPEAAGSTQTGLDSAIFERKIQTMGAAIDETLSDGGSVNGSLF